MTAKANSKASLKWIAPTRPFKKRSRDFYITMVSVAALFGLVLFVVEGFMPVLLIIGLVFLAYVMFTVEPGKAEYEITENGIVVAGSLVEWFSMGRFWFVERFGSEVLVVETAGFPGRLEIVVTAEVKPKIKSKLEKVLLHEEAPASFLDKTASWASKKLPNS